MAKPSKYAFSKDVLPLGQLIPNNEHAVSVSLPRLRDIIDYEEGKPRVLNSLAGGYPRFVFGASIRELCLRYRGHLAKGEDLVVLPSKKVAEACISFVEQGRVVETNDGVALAVVAQEKHALARKFWQHAGLIVSSRQAKQILTGKVSKVPPTIHKKLKKRIAELQSADKKDVYLFPSGMAAIYETYRAVAAQFGPATVQLGFPYTDTLAVQRKFGQGSSYIQYNGPKDLKALIERLESRPAAAVFCEVPGNPLLKTIDLEQLSSILKPFAVPLIIDNTLGLWRNVDVMPFADVVVTSLTKTFSGKADVMGGSVVLNKNSDHYGWLKQKLDQSEQLLHSSDAAVLFKNSMELNARVKKINHNTSLLAEALRAHPAVKEVYFTDNDPAHEAIRRAGGGGGGLLSFTLKDPTLLAEVYDNLRVAKGPSLGTDFTLVCPYTMLAHYTELGSVARSGVPADLLRVSVGREKASHIIGRFYEALDRAILKPNEARLSRSTTIFSERQVRVVPPLFRS